MFGTYKLAAIGIVLLAIGGRFYYINSALASAEQQNKTYETQIVQKEFVIGSLEESTKNLTDTITRLNAKYKQYKASSDKAIKALAVWRAKSDEVKYVKVLKKINPTDIDLSTATCDDGLKLNKAIAGLTYDDL